MSQPIRSLYVHVPFCRTICGYCDFYSIVYRPDLARRLVAALLTELDRWRPRLEGCIRTIFVGGGTPTTLPPELLEKLLRAVAALRDRSAELEFTVEANPATVDAATAGVLTEAGVTRVSIGAQSFDPAELRVLDRVHEPPQVAQTVAAVRAAGIGQVNLDLIFGIPGQRLERWLENLRRAIELEPEHLSCYCLTYEPGTPLHRRLAAGRVRPQDEDAEAKLFETTITTLASAGYRQYEISNYARPGCECRHNLTYWRNEPYVGLGPSAASYVDDVRCRNVPDARAYVEAIEAGRDPAVERELRSRDDQMRETMMLSLRLREGVDRARFRARFGADPCERFGSTIGGFVELGLVEVDAAAIRLTRRGLLLADSVIAGFLADDGRARSHETMNQRNLPVLTPERTGPPAPTARPG